MKQLHLFVLMSLLVPSVICAQEILFFDDFEGGMDDAWVMPDGGWVVEGGCLQHTGVGSLYSGGEQQSDYIVSYDFQITESSTRLLAGCYISLIDPVHPYEGNTSGYFIGYSYSFDLFETWSAYEIRRLDNGVITRLGSIPSDFTMEVQHIKLGRIGAELVVKHWVDGELEPNWLVSVVDESYHSGYWMPSLVGWIDNFKVEGYGTVSIEQSSWGGVKALYR